MGRGSPARSRSSKHKSSSYTRSHRNRSWSVERDSKSSRDRRRSRSRSTSKYSSRRNRYSRSRSRSLPKYGSSKSSSSSSKYQSSRRRRRSSSYSSSSESSYSSSSGGAHDKKITKKTEKMTIAADPPAPPNPNEMVFESVNLLHDVDKKPALDDLDNEGFVQKTFSSSKKPETVDLTAQAEKRAIEIEFQDSLLHHGVSFVMFLVPVHLIKPLHYTPSSYSATMKHGWKSGSRSCTTTGRGLLKETHKL